jgi:uncharacterized protein
MKINLLKVKKNPYIQEFINQTEKYLDALGYTDHGHRHINIVADRARSLAKNIGLNQHQQEISAIAGYCHDLGNFLGRTNHHYFGASLFSQIFLSQINPSDLSIIMQAITSHDKNELKLVHKVSAILILADKSDVHRTRVKNKNIKEIKNDIHDRVNYSVTKNDFKVDKKKKEIVLKLKVDTKITKPLEYFEIFTERMTYCRLAAEYLNYKFVLIINNFKLS